MDSVLNDLPVGEVGGDLELLLGDDSVDIFSEPTDVFFIVKSFRRIRDGEAGKDPDDGHRVESFMRSSSHSRPRILYKQTSSAWFSLSKHCFKLSACSASPAIFMINHICLTSRVL